MSQDYSPAARLLHRLALSRPAVAEASFALEEALHGRHPDPAPGKGEHVFVAGLARAGSTVLMRLLHGTGAFRSLTYRDMPFVLAPNLWAGLSRLAPRDLAARERAHGDGVAEDADSPEALEEVFWRVFCGPSYIGRRSLSPMRASDEAVARFRRYVALVLKRYRGERYLSKNNNNVLRLPSLRRAFPGALLLVPFRDPVQQALSLRAQHLRFAERQRRDPFARRYMTWLAHHEFGLDRRAFAPSSGAAGPGGDPGDDPAEPACWLRQWIAVYGNVWRQARDGEIEPAFVGYELLCREPGRVCGWLSARLGGIPREAFVFEPRESRADPSAVAGPRELLDRARDLYETMRRASEATFSARP